MMTTTLVWLLAWELLALIGLPFAWLLLRRHSDLGFGAARTLAALLFTYGVFLCGASGFCDRHRPALAAVLAAVAAASLAVAWYRRRDLARDLRRHRGDLLRSELLYLGSWGLLLAQLLYTDSPRYGERAFDLALLAHLALPGPLPPVNPYLAGEPLSYYYYGHLLYASIGALLGLAAPSTYFLAVATTGAMTITAAASTLSRLTASSAARWGALLLTCGAMNLGWLRDWLTGRAGDALAGSNRMVGNAIDEYPLYAMLLAELHAHVMVMPAFLLAVALVLAVRDTTQETAPRRWLPPCAALALVAGSVGATSAWSLLALGMVVASMRSRGRGPAAFAAGIVLYLPFFLGLRAAYPWPRLVGDLTSAPLGFVLHWGLFLWLLAAALATAGSSRLASRKMIAPLFVVAVAAWIAIRLAGGASALPLAVAAVAATLAALRATGGSATEDREAWTLTAIGWLVIAACEIVHLDDYQSGPLERASTVFKLYMDAWLLLGLGAAAPLAQLAALASGPAGVGRGAARAWIASLFLLLVVGAASTAAGVYAKTDGWRSGPNLSPVHFMGAVDSGYAEAMRWLARLPIASSRRPIVAEAVDPDRLSGWLAVAAPVDAYVAWPNLLVQWGYAPAEIRPRLDNLRRLYTMADAAASCGLMTAEGIDYVFAGARERRQFGAAAGAAFTAPPFRRVFVAGDSALYACREAGEGGS